MTICTGCGRKHQRDVAACPYCGNTKDEPMWRAVLWIAIVISFIAALIGGYGVAVYVMVFGKSAWFALAATIGVIALLNWFYRSGTTKEWNAILTSLLNGFALGSVLYFALYTAWGLVLHRG
jgi:RNA polymerase subunit RPABC4/transcription elongation factor Spt4